MAEAEWDAVIKVHLKGTFGPAHHAAKHWRELVKNEVLYSKKQEEVTRLMGDGPFTAGFPRESPGHIGEWIGYRIVRSYLDDHPEVTFAQLFAMTDPRAILKSYKPR